MPIPRRTPLIADGEVASKQRDCFLMAMWPAVVIMIGVLGAVVVIMLRFRRRSDDEMPVQTHGNTPLELGWTIAPAILLAILAVPMMILLFDIGREPDNDAFVVNVEGQRFSWVFEYPEIKDDKGKPVVTHWRDVRPGRPGGGDQPDVNRRDSQLRDSADRRHTRRHSQLSTPTETVGWTTSRRCGSRLMNRVRTTRTRIIPCTTRVSVENFAAPTMPT